MIKGNCVALDKETGETVNLVMFGLSHKNLDKLREGFPIRITEGEKLGIPGVQILIFAEKDERTMLHQLESMISAATIVEISKKLLD